VASWSSPRADTDSQSSKNDRTGNTKNSTRLHSPPYKRDLLKQENPSLYKRGQKRVSSTASTRQTRSRQSSQHTSKPKTSPVKTVAGLEPQPRGSPTASRRRGSRCDAGSDSNGIRIKKPRTMQDSNPYPLHIQPCQVDCLGNSVNCITLRQELELSIRSTSQHLLIVFNMFFAFLKYLCTISLPSPMAVVVSLN
jgi:hypothetical protein